MMKRLYNEYGACDFRSDVVRKCSHLYDALDEIWNNLVINEDFCPRDVKSFCSEEIDIFFAEHILRRAMIKRRKERET